MPDERLGVIRVVLDEPQDPVNIAAVVRAMKNMGVHALWIVNGAAIEPERVEGVAHGTADIVRDIRRVATLDEALAECAYVAAFTARRRAATREVIDVRTAAARVSDAAAHGPAALLFGREDRGLSNTALDRAHVVVTIPTTAHPSLNLAQAVMVALYELHVAIPGASRRLAPPRKHAPPATVAELERLFQDVERALHAIDFFKSRYPEHILRTVRSLVHRAAPDAREVGLLRAFALEAVHVLERRGGRHDR
ncbi:MAG TPA: TrmJ/YjtD family RNA methyltransferase [Gemmatimonadaceae bacterium]|nr:TrmJ/YjtD family RNA methyltransferase [Gemmatimonadaceae bacterium]